MKKLILILFLSYFSTLSAQQVSAAYTLVDGRMPIFDYLFENLQQNPALDNVITEALYNQIFSKRGEYYIPATAPASPPFTNTQAYDPITGKMATDYKYFKDAVNYLYTRGGDFKKLLNEGGDTGIKRELAAIFAHSWQETKGFAYNAEAGYHPLFDTHTYNGYHGRGPKQLSYNYNYERFNEFLFGTKQVLMLGGTLPLNGVEVEVGPGALAIDGRMAWLGSLHFIMTGDGSKPSMHEVMLAPKDKTYNYYIVLSDEWRTIPAGFGLTTNVINGGIECNVATEHPQSEARITYYKNFLSLLGGSDDRLMECSQPNVTAYLNTLSISELENQQNAIQIYPNPTADKLYFKIKGSKMVSYLVYNLLGSLVLKGTTATNYIDVNTLSLGQYTIHLKNGDSNTNKLVKRFFVNASI